MGLFSARRPGPSALFALCTLGPTVAYAQSGVPAGSLDLNVGLKLEMGVDTNPLYANAGSDVNPSGVVQINPYVALRTREPRMLSLDGALGAKWEQFLSGELTSGEVQGSAINGADLEGSFGLRLNPNGLVSVRPSDSLAYASDPILSPNGDPTRALYNNFGLEIGFHPGGADASERTGLSGEVHFTHQLSLFQGLQDDYDSSGIGGGFMAKYNFLPKTAVFLQGSVISTGFKADSVGAVLNSGSLPMRYTAGFTGLLAPRLSLLVLAGYGGSNFENGEDLTTFVGQIELGGHLGDAGDLSFGWERNFRNAIVANYSTYHRVYGSFTGSADRLSYGLGAETRLSTFSSAVVVDEAGVVSETDYWVDENGDGRRDTTIKGDLEVSYGVADWMTVGGRYNPVIRASNAVGADLGFSEHRAFAFVAFHDIFRRPSGLSGLTGQSADPNGLR